MLNSSGWPVFRTVMEKRLNEFQATLSVTKDVVDMYRAQGVIMYFSYLKNWLGEVLKVEEVKDESGN